MSLLVICEGLDGAGKTTTIKQFLKNEKENNNNNSFVYSKGIGSDTFIGKIARKHPSTFMFLSELIYVKYKIIKPNLKKNKIILQDRYDFSVLTYPTAGRWYNKLIGKIFNSFIIEPDALVYFEVSPEERIKRLKKDFHNKYHLTLAENPDLITSREKKYLEFYNKFKGYKTKIDTTNLTAKQSAELLRAFLWE